MIKVERNNTPEMKPYISIIGNAKITEITPLLIPIAKKMNLNLSKLVDFRKAVKTLEVCILHEIWETGWNNVNWDIYTDIRIKELNIENFNINKQLLSDFLRIRSKNIIHDKRTSVAR